MVDGNRRMRRRTTSGLESTVVCSEPADVPAVRRAPNLASPERRTRSARNWLTPASRYEPGSQPSARRPPSGMRQSRRQRQPGAAVRWRMPASSTQSADDRWRPEPEQWPATGVPLEVMPSDPSASRRRRAGRQQLACRRLMDTTAAVVYRTKQHKQLVLCVWSLTQKQACQATAL